MIRRTLTLAALAGLLILGGGGVPAHAVKWRVFEDYFGQSYLVMKKSDRKLSYVVAGPDWSCFRGKKDGSEYRGKVKTVIDTYPGWAKVRRIAGNVETPAGVQITQNYGYGVQRSEWVQSRASAMRERTDTTVRDLARWC